MASDSNANEVAPPPAPPQEGAPPLEVDLAGIRQQIADGANVQTNLQQDILVVPANTVSLKLYVFERAVAARHAWLGPAGVVLGCLSNLMTLEAATSFGTVFGMGREMWMGINVAILVMSAGVSIGLGIKAYGSRKEADPDGFIEKLRRR